MKKLLVAACILCCIQNTNAQSFDTLSSAKITANRIFQPAHQTGRVVSVITQKEIENSPASSIDELLRTVAGININSRGGFGVQSDIGLRGSTFSQVLLMLDNMRINDPLTGHFNHILPVALSEIAQIEIIRGPAAVAFGSDAVGGMIHIKTKAYLSSYKKDTLNMKADVAYGQYNLLNGDAYINKVKNNWNIGVSSKILSSDGEKFSNPNFPNPSSKEFFNTDFSAQTYGAHIGKVFNNGVKIYGRYGLDLREFNAKYFYTASTFDESRERVNSHWAQLSIIKNVYKRSGSSFDGPFYNRSFEINAGYRNTKDSFVFNPLFSPNFHTMQKWALNLNKNYQVSEVLQFAFGAQSEFRLIESTDRGNHDEIDAGVYLISQYQKDKIFFTLSQRLAYNTNYDVAYLPQLSASYTPNRKWNFKASAGRSIRAADFTERYVSYNIPSLGNGRNAGNPDLQEEVSNAADIFAEYTIDKHLRLQATLFVRNSENLIDYSPTLGSEINNLTNVNDTLTYFYAKNFESANTQGIELSILFAKKFNKFNLNGNINYTYLATQSNGGVPSKYISNHPTNNIGLFASLSYQKVKINVNANYINRNEQTNTLPTIYFKVPESYLLINPQIQVEVKKGISVYAQVNNLLDQQYQEILGSPMPGRWIFGGVKVAL
jgi:iron complex outermembrane receptor protein